MRSASGGRLEYNTAVRSNYTPAAAAITMRQQSDQLILFLLLPLQLGALSSASLLNWATGHGAYVAPELCISEASPVSPRALRVARDVPEGAVLCAAVRAAARCRAAPAMESYFGH